MSRLAKAGRLVEKLPSLYDKIKHRKLDSTIQIPRQPTAFGFVLILVPIIFALDQFTRSNVGALLRCIGLALVAILIKNHDNGSIFITALRRSQK